MEELSPTLTRSVPVCQPAKDRRENRNVAAAMEELLLPSAEEEARSEHSSYGPGPAGKTGTWDRAKGCLKAVCQEEPKRSVKAFFKQHGLLTLSVIAVATGCTLGFMLRGTQLSTQVPHRDLDPDGTEPGFPLIMLLKLASFSSDSVFIPL